MRTPIISILLGPMVVVASLADEPARPTKRPRETTNSIGIRLVTIPAGGFDVGSRDPAQKLHESLRIEAKFTA